MSEKPFRIWNGLLSMPRLDAGLIDIAIVGAIVVVVVAITIG